jgi:hypothetical protein
MRFTLSDILNAAGEFEQQNFRRPNRINITHALWDQFLNENHIYTCERIQPFKLFGMDIHFDESVNGFEVTDEQPLRYSFDPLWKSL